MLIYKYVTKGISVSFNRAPAQVNKINQALIKQAVLVNIISWLLVSGFFTHYPDKNKYIDDHQRGSNIYTLR